MPPNNHLPTVIIGTTAPLVGTGVSFINALEAWMRLGSVAVGLAIGCIALYRMFKEPPHSK